MATYNIVTNSKILQEIKKSKYFKQNLGFASTMESKKSDFRLLSNSDSFAYSYNITYKTTIYASGQIGNISFYTDHHITEDVVAIYIDTEEFVLKFDFILSKEKGIDPYIGFLLKTSDTEFETRINLKKEEIEKKKEKVGNFQHVIDNPGGASYEDLKAYMEWKNTQRLKS